MVDQVTLVNHVMVGHVMVNHAMVHLFRVFRGSDYA